MEDKKYVAVRRTITINNADLSKDWSDEEVQQNNSLQVVDQYIPAQDTLWNLKASSILNLEELLQWRFLGWHNQSYHRYF